MAHNRTVSFNTNSEVLSKKISSLLFYVDIAKERIIQDSEYPTSNEIVCSIDEARHLLVALNNLFTVEPSEVTPADSSFDLLEFSDTVPQ
jgi:hypothetical protein